MWTYPCETKGLNFGISSDACIVAVSVAEINKASLKPETGSVYDPRLGLTGEEEVGTLCPTCEHGKEQCPGHFGHVELAAPVILFYREAASWAKRCCHRCGALNPLPKAPILPAFSLCLQCGAQHPMVRLVNSQDPLFVKITLRRKNGLEYSLDPASLSMILDRIKDSEVDRALNRGIGSSIKFHPRRLVMTKLPVLPPCCRPCVRQWPEGGVQDDNLSVFISQIVKINNKIKNLAPCHPNICELITQLRFKILCFVDNSKGKAMHATNRKPMVGIKERLSKKTGILRQNMMGKRRDQTGRSVVGPDGTLELDQVGVPEEIADNLTVPERVTFFNLDRLKKKLEQGKIINVIDKYGIKTAIRHFSAPQLLEHGDVLENANGDFAGYVVDCKNSLPVGWKVKCRNTDRYKNCISIPLPLLELCIGQTVERTLEDGDPVALNRQPTLHRNSMLGMRVKRMKGKTIRLNLAVTAGFNMDFDGDEGNLYLPQGPQARTETLLLMAPQYVIMSTRAPCAEVTLVQDAVLGAHLMSLNRLPASSEERSFCLLEVMGMLGWDASGDISKAQSPLSWLELLLPKDFCLTTNEGLIIKKGKILAGYLTKRSLKTIIKLVCLEYNGHTAGKLTDCLQFVTNAWLSCRPFSAGYIDCLLTNPIESKQAIEAAVRVKFAQAESGRSEMEVSAALCGARDTGQVLASQALTLDNRLAVMARAGSKGDLFNLTQISSLLGQQYVDGRRPYFETENGRRTLPHYPRIWKAKQSTALKYESRGFISSSFLSGLNPREVFFHAKSGREGMINTSQMTGVTGYAERKMVKLNEDLMAAYDGTIRDAMQNIVQFIYGDHGLDPQRCYSNAKPVDFSRLSNRLNCTILENVYQKKISPLNNLKEALELLPATLCPGAPFPLRDRLFNFHAQNLLDGAQNFPCIETCAKEWRTIVTNMYATAILQPGEAVGVLCAQSIGAKQTQQTLDTFHRAGGLLESSCQQFGELLNLSQRPKRRQCVVPLLVDENLESDKVRDLLGEQLICRPLTDLLAPGPVRPTENRCLRLNLDSRICFELRLHPGSIACALVKKFPPPHFTIKISAFHLDLTWSNPCPADNLLTAVLAVQVGDMPGIQSFQLVKDPRGRWTAVTKGSNLKALLAHPLTITTEVRSDDIWDVYRTLGLTAAKKRLGELMTNCVGDNLHSAHVKLLVDRMMRRGKPTPIDRYTMRICKVGPLSRAAFEESLDILTGAAVSAEKEACNGVGAQVVMGLHVKAGTGFPQLIYKQSLFDPFY